MGRKRFEILEFSHALGACFSEQSHKNGSFASKTLTVMLKQFCLSYVGYSYKKEITFCIKTDHSVDVPLDFQVPESFYCL